VLFQKVTLAGVGLLGGSLGLALRQRGLARKVDGLVRRTASIAECEQLSVVDHATRDPSRAAEDADLIVLCTPLSRMKEVLQRMLPACKPGVLVTDVGSAKQAVVRELEPIVSSAGGHFVGSHPMAGAEKTGPSAARADLFAEAICVLTPTPQSSAIAVRKIEELWKAVGARVLRMKPEVHDDLVSRSSHLPHIVAAELANYVLSPAHPKEQRMLCASGFRDTTRVASSSPEMWRDIVLANRENLIRVLGVFLEGLEEFRHSLETRDERAVTEFFEQARSRRENWNVGGAPMRSPE
jgi:prephenate dehydrogenase